MLCFDSERVSRLRPPLPSASRLAPVVGDRSYDGDVRRWGPEFWRQVLELDLDIERESTVYGCEAAVELNFSSSASLDERCHNSVCGLDLLTDEDNVFLLQLQTQPLRCEVVPVAVVAMNVPDDAFIAEKLQRACCLFVISDQNSTLIICALETHAAAYAPRRRRTSHYGK